MGKPFDPNEIINNRKTLARREDEANEGLSSATPATPPADQVGAQAKFSGYTDGPTKSRTPPKHMLAQRDRQP